MWITRPRLLALSTAIMASGLVAATAVAVEPTTAADFSRHLGEWFATKLAADFQAHGRKDAPWADQLAAFHAAFAAAIADQFADEAGLAKLEGTAADLVKAGCDDPVFLMGKARLGIAKQQLREAQLALRKALPAVQKAGYPPFYEFLNLSWTRRTMPGGMSQPMPKLYEAAIAAARDPAFAGRDRQIYVRSVMPTEGPFLAAAAKAFALPDSGVDPWIAAVVAGRAAIVAGWEARGNEFAHKVTPEGWKTFEAQLALAREQLTKAHEMHPELPEAAAEMITVSMADGSDEERLWFDRAVAAEFDHADSYQRFGLNALLPRWGGSHEEMLEFGRAGLATGRFETIVPSTFLDAALAVGRELPDARDVFALPGVYDDCLKVAAGYLGVSTSPRVTEVWKSRLVIIHWAAGHYDAACAVLDDLGDTLAARALEDFRVKPDDVVAECRLFAGPHADAAAAAEESIAAGKVADALTAYTALAERGDLPAPVRRLVAGRVATLKMAKAVADHEWVDIQPPADLGGWRQVGGDWTLQPDGTLSARADKGRLKLICESEFGQDVEFTAEIDLVERPTPQKNWERCVIMLAHAAGDDTRNDAVAVRLSAPHRGLWVRRGYKDEGEQWAAAPLKAKNALRLVLWDGKLSVFVNGDRVVDKFAVPDDWLGGGGLAIGEYSSRPLALRIRAMRARKLDKAPDDF